MIRSMALNGDDIDVVQYQQSPKKAIEETVKIERAQAAQTRDDKLFTSYVRSLVTLV